MRKYFLYKHIENIFYIFHVYNLQETFILIDFLLGSFFSILQKVLSSFVKTENFEELSLIDVDNR